MKLSSSRAVLLLAALPWLCHAAAEVTDAESCDGERSGAKAAAGSSMLQSSQQRTRSNPHTRRSIKQRMARLRRVQSNTMLALARRGVEHAAGVKANPCKSEDDFVSTNAIDAYTYCTWKTIKGVPQPKKCGDSPECTQAGNGYCSCPTKSACEAANMRWATTTCGSYFKDCAAKECEMLNEKNVDYSASSDPSDGATPTLGVWVQHMAKQCCRSFPASKRFPDRIKTNPCRNPQKFDADHKIMDSMKCEEAMDYYEMDEPLDGYAAARKGECNKKVADELDWVVECCKDKIALCKSDDTSPDHGDDDTSPDHGDDYPWPDHGDDTPSS